MLLKLPYRYFLHKSNKLMQDSYIALKKCILIFFSYSLVSEQHKMGGNILEISYKMTPFL